MALIPLPYEGNVEHMLKLTGDAVSNLLQVASYFLIPLSVIASGIAFIMFLGWNGAYYTEPSPAKTMLQFFVPLCWFWALWLPISQIIVNFSQYRGRYTYFILTLSLAILTVQIVFLALLLMQKNPRVALISYPKWF